MLDVLITDAEVYDGVSPRCQRVSVGLIGDRIVHVGDRPIGHAAHTHISAPGRVLCPGFVDSHASTSLGHLLPNPADHRLHQGITTEVVGNCGTAEAPVGPHGIEAHNTCMDALGLSTRWSTMAEWRAALTEHGLPIHVATHVGHNTLRRAAGIWDAPPTTHQRQTMARLLQEGLSAGALGLSSGLIYAPGCFAQTEELIELASHVARAGGIYASHIRDERHGLFDAIEEALEIGRQASLPVLISHLKSAERPNWGRIPAVLNRLEEARGDGQAVTFEVYPYTAVSTRLRAFLPVDLRQGGETAFAARLRQHQHHAKAHLHARGTDFAALMFITDSLPGAQGCSVADIAHRQHQDPAQVAIDALLADPDAWIIYHCIDEADMDAAVCWPDAIVCSDAWSQPVNAPTPIGDPHPRTYGAFTHFLERYALSGRIPFGDAIRKITSLPADWLGLTNRGRIEVGAIADLTLLNPDQLQARATYTRPRQLSEGTEQVWVCGVAMFDEQGHIARHTPGQCLQRTSP